MCTVSFLYKQLHIYFGQWPRCSLCCKLLFTFFFLILHLQVVWLGKTWLFIVLVFGSNKEQSSSFYAGLATPIFRVKRSSFYID